MKNEIVLSICIPTRNRSTKLNGIVKNILKYPYNDIEVVVVDNDSEDNTVEMLKGIEDTRLKIYENEKNIGAQPNFIKAIKLGQGKYIQALHDRDNINVNGLKAFISLLKNSNYAVISNHYMEGGGTTPLELKLPEAVYHIIINSHMSYFVFNRDILNKIKGIEKFGIEMELSGCYSFIPLSISMCQYADYFLNTKIKVVIPANEKMLQRYDSHGTDNIKRVNLLNRFTGFEPKGRIHMYFYLVKYVMSKNYIKPILAEVILKIYQAQLEWATIGFLEFIKSDILVERYSYNGPRKSDIVKVNIMFMNSAIGINKIFGLEKIVRKKDLKYITIRNIIYILKLKIKSKLNNIG